MSVARYLAGCVLAVTIATIVLLGLAFTAAGFIVLIPFLGCWWAKPLPTFDDEVKALLREAR